MYSGWCLDVNAALNKFDRYVEKHTTMREFCTDAYDDCTRSQRKCGTCYKVIWVLVIICIILISSGNLYWNEIAGMIALSIGISLGIILFVGAGIICIGGCFRCADDRSLPLST
jgi:hypothetical protein